MKTNLLVLAILITSASLAQDVKKNITIAQASYQAGKLQDTHFALQQIMQDLDITMGKEIIKLLPATLDTLAAVTGMEQVTGNCNYAGVTIQKVYGKGQQRAEIQILLNSPLQTSLNAYISSPLMGGMGDPNSKIVKVSGYKAKLTRETGNSDAASNYRIEIPLNNAIVSMSINNGQEAAILNWANNLPLTKMAALIQ